MQGLPNTHMSKQSVYIRESSIVISARELVLGNSINAYVVAYLLNKNKEPHAAYLLVGGHLHNFKVGSFTTTMDVIDKWTRELERKRQYKNYGV
jgi:hypothetical protein